MEFLECAGGGRTCRVEGGSQGEREVGGGGGGGEMKLSSRSRSLRYLLTPKLDFMMQL